MRWSIIRLIWVRELRDQLRDRRTLFMIAVLPLLLYPVLGVGVLQFALGFADRYSVVGVVEGPAGTRDFPELPDTSGLDALAEYIPFLRQGEVTILAGKTAKNSPDLHAARDKVKFQFLPDKAVAEALEKDQVDLVLQAPADFLAVLEKGEALGGKEAVVTIQGKADQDRFRLAMHRLVPLVDAWKKELKAIRLTRLGLPGNFDEPFRVEEPKAAKPSGGPESLLDLMIRIFPFMLVMWSLAGALYPAVDLCAGEKERGTMETLLISPAGREEIVLGKFLTIWVFSGGTALLNLVSMGMTTWQFANQLPQGSLPLWSLLWFLVLLLPLSAFFSAICLAVGAYARSSKEGQYYLMPLFLVTMPMMFLTLAPGVELSPFYSLVPVTGAALLMQKLMTTSSLADVPWLYFIPVLAPIVLYSVLALRWAIDQFQREEVLFREAERLDIMLWLRRLFREKEATPTTGQAYFAFGLLLTLSWLTVSLSKETSMLVFTAVRMLAFVATPTILMALMLNTRPLEGLSRWPRLAEVGLAAVLAVLLLPPLAALTQLVFTQFPHLTKLLEDCQPLMQELRSLHEGRQLAQDQVISYLLVFALLPAICEEIAFRGFILSGLRKNFRPRTAVVLSSFLFALFHMNVFQFLPSFFLGVVLGLLTLRSRSLVPAMMFHLLHNSVLIAISTWWPSWKNYLPEYLADLWLPFISICLAVASGLLWWLYRKPYVELERELASRP